MRHRDNKVEDVSNEILKFNVTIKYLANVLPERICMWRYIFLIPICYFLITNMVYSLILSVVLVYVPNPTNTNSLKQECKNGSKSLK